MQEFSLVSGLKVNWHKSLFFPTDYEASVQAPGDLQLQWVTTFTYLGVAVTHYAKMYVDKNLIQWLAETKLKNLRYRETCPHLYWVVLIWSK